MNEKKKRTEKKKNKKKVPSDKSSLLTRLFGNRQKKAPQKRSEKVKAKPLTPLQRSIAEIQQMTKIGQRDPERLAQLLITMLGKERAKEEVDRQQFEQQVWDIVNRDNEKAADASDDEDAPARGPT